MQKTTKNMAVYIKNIIPSNIPETYTIKQIFKNISSENSIRKGIIGFRDFLYHFCDYIIADDSLYDKPSREIHEFLDNISLPLDFPFLNELSSILVNIGFYGILDDNSQSLSIADWQLLAFVGNANLRSQKKMVVPKLIEGLRYLKNCGIIIEGIDLNIKKPDIAKVETLKISFPKNPIMLLGLKVMAIAQNQLRTSGHEDFFLCCNYRILKEESTDASIVLKDFINPLTSNMQDFVMKLHQLFIEAGLITKVEVKYFIFRFIYSYKNKEICTISTSLNGYSLIIKMNNIINFPDIFNELPLLLQQKISKGFGCYRKIGGDHCDGGCQGFRFSLDDSLIAMSEDIVIWLDKELSSLKRK